ncbi:hypothetical protein [Sulfurimonas sp.]|uniref:hypothetical protein n=1 Tax=Sulfurimonas sp. TaxID=2022749 RepID=UPI0025CDCD60|nr:hypothetical protein [Sulfurimonas sp.]
MKLKSFTTFALLFVLGFSIIHEYVHIAYDENHLSVIEYVNEADQSVSHDTHCEYHQSFLVSQNSNLTDIDFKLNTSKINKETYNFKTNLEFYKPPIS